jgi:tRNA A37 N6-isopentenylltransferase MiaA
VLHARIARRFDTMLLAGFVDEVIRLRRHYRLDPNLPSMRCVGYRQALEYLDGASTCAPSATRASSPPASSPSARSPGSATSATTGAI